MAIAAASCGRRAPVGAARDRGHRPRPARPGETDWVVRHLRKPDMRVRDVITCGGCPAQWTAPTAAHCGKCHRLFAAVSLFDRHRDPEGEHGTCLDPAEIGLHFRGGMWRGAEMPAAVLAALRGVSA